MKLDILNSLSLDLNIAPNNIPMMISVIKVNINCSHSEGVASSYCFLFFDFPNSTIRCILKLNSDIV